MPAPDLPLDYPPYRLSGVVYGVLLNDPAMLTKLGEAVHAPPYKAPPQAPVLYLKPRNTLAAEGDVLRIPPGFDSVEIGANLGLIIGRTACRVPVEQALSYVVGYLAVNDVCLPHESFYRPSVRLRARDGYCPLASQPVPAACVADPDSLGMRVCIDGVTVQETNTRGRLRGAARLLADVTEFMTLQPGDVLLLGASHGAPRARAGQTVRVEIEGVGRIDNPVAAEEGVS